MARSGIRLVAFASFLLSVSLFAESPTELFQKAKAQVKSQSWQEALTTLDQLDAVSATPGNENVRQQLVAPIAFYRGVCEANLDQAEKAEADFAIFRQEQPGSTIDKATYSKKAVAAFDAAGKSAKLDARGKEAAPQRSVSILRRFEEFEAPPNTGEKPDERWADGPAKWLLTPEETAAWGALTGDAERAEFVENFWETAQPESRLTGQPGARSFRSAGRVRGLVFPAAGAAARKHDGSGNGVRAARSAEPYRPQADPGNRGEQHLGRFVRPGYWYMAERNSVHFAGHTATDASSGFREVWYYRRETLPRAVSAIEVTATFVTKVEFGQFVLQRRPEILSALAAARSGVPESRVAGKARPK